MPTTLQFRRGNTAVASATTGANGEIFINLDTKQIHVHDGSTAGGFALANASSVATALAAAGNAYSNAVSVAAADATTKANQAYSNAVSVAATDATTKANQAYSNAISFANSLVANLVNSAPDALNTLQELAAALGNDANFSTTVINTFAAKANPTFTGTVTLPAVSANSSTGSAGQVLTSNGSGVYWSNASGGGTSYDQSLNTNDAVQFTQVSVGPVGLQTIIYNDGISINGNFAVTENNLKTINGQSIVGSGDISISGGGSSGIPIDLPSANGSHFIPMFTTANGQVMGNETWTAGIVDTSISYNPDFRALFLRGQELDRTTKISATEISIEKRAFGMTSEGAVSLYADGLVVSNTQAGRSFVLSTNNTISINGNVGTVGQVLTSGGGNSVYWSTPAASGVNTSASFIWSNTHSFYANTTFESKVFLTSSLFANGTVGTAGQVLTSDGTKPYWSTISGGGFTNGQSISVNDLDASGNIAVNQITSRTGVLFLGYNIANQSQFALSEYGIGLQANTFLPNNGKSLIANGSAGSPGQVLTSAGVGSNVYWSTPTGGGSLDLTSGANVTIGNATSGCTYVRIDGSVLLVNAYTSFSQQTNFGQVSVFGRLDTYDTTQFNSNVVFSNGSVFANGSGGSAGQVLTSSGFGVYWSTVSGGEGVNTAVNYTWTNNHSFTANVTSNNTLTTGVARFTGNTRIQGRLSDSANLNGTAGQVLTSTGTGVLWSNIDTNINITKSSFTGNGANTEFTLEANATADSILVHVNGMYYHPEEDYTVDSNTSRITFTSAPADQSKIRIRYFPASGLSTSAGDLMTLTGVEDLMTGSGSENLQQS